MNESNQNIIKFNHENNLNKDDFFISSSNKHILDLFDIFPNWEKNFLNIIGEKFSGKTHLVNIFLNRFKGFQIDAKSLNENILDNIKINENIIIENLNKDIDENLLYTLFDLIEQNHKYLIITSEIPIVDLDFNLNDLKSRSKNFLLQKIEKPDDELIFAIILKYLSDKQISLDKSLIDFIVKRIDRSYGKIFDLLYKIDEVSLKKKKAIDLKIIKEVLGV